MHREEREMSISLKDFFRLLPIALKDIEYQISNNDIYVSYAGGKIEIKPGSEYSRQIASLTLPVLDVVFTFNEVSADDISNFMVGFSRVYQRGGG